MVTQVPVKNCKDYSEVIQKFLLCKNAFRLHPDSSHELRESYDFVTNPQHFRKNDMPDFDSSNIELKNECKPLIKKILRVLAISLGLKDEDFFLKSSQNIDDPTVKSYSAFRTIYYPPVGDNVAVNTVRCAEHSDYGILTVLFQDDAGGLEV